MVKSRCHSPYSKIWSILEVVLLALDIPIEYLFYIKRGILSSVVITKLETITVVMTNLDL